MEINRIANNVDFIKKIILSIDPDEENYTLNYSNFRYTFQKELERSGDPSAALEIASEKLKKTIERRKQVFLKDQDVIKKTPKKEKPEKQPTSRELFEEQSAFNNEVKEKRRQEILDLLKSKSGFEDEEVLNYLLGRFRRTKDYLNLPDDVAADKVVYQYKEKMARETPPEEAPAPPTEEDLRKAARIIEFLDPKNVSNNLQRFQTYLSKHNIEKSFQFTQDYIKYRQFLKENNIPSSSINIKIFDEYGQDYDKAIEIIKKRQEKGAMPLDSRVVGVAKGETSEANDYIVNFEGQKVSLYRVLQRIYPNMQYSLFKKSYSTILYLIFSKGYTLDEAIAQNNKENLIVRNKSMFQREFPEDPDQAEMIFESYFIDGELTFAEALAKTKQDIYGNRSTTAQKAKYKIRIK